VRFCQYCGKDIDESVRFCPNCGKAVGVNNTNTAEVNNTRRVEVNNSSERRYYDNRTNNSNLSSSAPSTYQHKPFSKKKWNEYSLAEKQKVFIIFGFIFAVILTVVLVTYFTYSSNKENNEQYADSYYYEDGIVIENNPIFNVSYNSFLGWQSQISGKCKNVSGQDISYINIKFGFYNELGNLIDTTWCYSTYLGKGETWEFASTMYTDIKPESCKILQITAF
jgi:hypothetical protein